MGNARNEIDEVLYRVSSEIGKVPDSELLRQLDDLSKYVPYSSLYHNVKAEILLNKGDYEGAFSELYGTENWWNPSKFANQTAKLISESYKGMGDEFRALQFSILAYYLEDEMNYESDISLIEGIIDKTHEWISKGLDEGFNSSVLKELEILSRVQWRYIEAIITYAVYCKKNPDKVDQVYSDHFFEELKHFEPNVGFIWEQLTTAQSILLVIDKSDNIDYYIYLALLLKQLDIEVSLIGNEIDVEMDYEIDLDDTIGISFENIEYISEIKLIRPINVIYPNEIKKSNIGHILEFISRENNNFITIISSIAKFDMLFHEEKLESKIQLLSQSKSTYYNNFLGFGYLGDYTSYISKIYKLNYNEFLISKPEIKFSIVIPARNSAYTLRKTLETCLNQRGVSSQCYEIVISDNSTDFNDEIINLVNEMDDERIKYYKTPRNLPLNRSFEYAISKTRGDFIITLGSDDGILPWGLETISAIIDRYPEEEIIAWHRIFFQWSDSDEIFSPGKLVIPKCYKKNEFNEEFIDLKSSLKTILDNLDKFLYSIPTLYINSGFKKSYLNKILSKTGKLWDGYTQDMYMAMVNVLINDKYLNVNYPITIAGMSNSSLGAKTVVRINSKEKLFNKNVELACDYGFGISVINKYKMEPIEVDISLVLAELYRIIEKPELKAKFDTASKHIDFEKLLNNIASRIDPQNMNYFIRLNQIKRNAYVLDQNLGEKFENDTYKRLINSVYERNVKELCKEYKTGFINESLFLDARKFNVNDIYEASCLIENILGL